MTMTKRMRSGWMAAGVMAVAMASAGAQQGVGAQQAGGTTSPVKDDLFAGTEVFAKGASDVTEITMDPDTLGMVGGKASSRAHSMVLNVVRTYTYDKPGMYRMEDVEAFRNKLNTGDWHCSVHTRSLKTGDSTDVCSKRRSDDMVESAIITVEPKELTFIHTIRKRGAGESAVSDMPLLLQMRGMGPEMRAEMMLAQAEMKADMATMKPEMQAEMALARAQMGAGMRAGMGDLDRLKIEGNGLKHQDLLNVPGAEAPMPMTVPVPLAVPVPPVTAEPAPAVGPRR